MLAPLAERMRPATFNDFEGQENIAGKNSVLRNAVENNNAYSMIFWGPPGTGKTTLAKIISQKLGRDFFQLSAISSGVKEVRDVIEASRKLVRINHLPPVLFIDEIHRFNKSQQDSLLGAVEEGIIILIGATTENPSFEINKALLSRCEVYTLNSLSEEQLKNLATRALKNDEILAKKKINIAEWEVLLRASGGDARKLLNGIELIAGNFSEKEIYITNKIAEEVLQKKMAMYDKGGEQHYDIISAFIKSMRGSDPNAAVYWLARMIEGGEDPLFIARRMLILASEDIGNANPNALVIANSCFEACEKIGYPECRIILSQTAIYLACSAKSNASYAAIENALSLVRETGDQPVPMHLRNAPTKLMKDSGYGKNYKYAHSFENNFVDEEFFPEKISGNKLYNPGANAKEEEYRKLLRKLWKEKYEY